jgi:hypothetical protein
VQWAGLSGGQAVTYRGLGAGLVGEDHRERVEPWVERGDPLQARLDHRPGSRRTGHDRLARPGNVQISEVGHGPAA